MMKIKLLLLLFFVAPTFLLAQDKREFFMVKTNTTEVKIPGKWEQLNKMDDSGQTYLKNEEGVIIAVAQNPKKAYSFFKSNKSDFDNVKAFYKWDSDFRKENRFPVEKLKENAKQQYIIWKFNEDNMDNVFLFGSSKANFLNLLVYSNLWQESEKIQFLESLYELNK